MRLHLPARGRRWPSTVGAVVVPAVLIGLALVYPGARVSQVELNDGAVWLTRTSQKQVARLNSQVGELNGSVTGRSADIDVLQDAQWVLVHDGTSIATVDPADVVETQTSAVPVDSTVSMARGVLAVTAPDGSLWVRPMTAVGDLTTTPSGDHQLGTGASAVVSRTSGVVLAATSSGELHRIELDGGASGDTVVGQLAGDVTAADEATAVGDVLVTRTGSVLHTPSAEIDLSDYGDEFLLQQPGPASDRVLVSSPSALIEVPLVGGALDVHPSGGTGTAAAPVQVGSCGYAAWSGSTSLFMRLCGPSAKVDPLPGVGPGAQLTFRVNRDVVVLNDLVGGGFWPVQDSLVSQMPDWDALLQDPQESQGDQATQDPSTQTLQAECTDQSGSPRAVDDDYGVRAGRTQILSVIDNDVSSDCGILTIIDVDPLDPAFGTVTPIYGGRALQLVTAPGAEGSATFSYTISDGRGASAPSRASVRLDVHGPGENRAPVQLHVGRLIVEAGATATYQALPDFTDPDGDQLVLVQGTQDGEGSLQVRQDGTVTFTAATGSLGEQNVRLVVSDGSLTVTGDLVVDVRQPGSVVPVIDPVHVQTTVGVPVTVHPLASVRSASREPVRLAKVDAQPGVTLSTDLDGGTFTFSASQPSTYYVSFTVTAAPQQATGIARIDVLPAATDQTPVAVLDVALLPPGGEVVIDPVANDTDPAGNVLVLTSVDPPAGSGLQVAILDHHLVRITAQYTLDASVSVPYTVSNGVASAVGEIRVKPIQAQAGDQPPVVPDVTATVRAGGVVTVPVLASAYDPDGDPLTVVRTLVQEPAPGEGLAFVSGDVLRFQASDTAGTVKVAFGVTDGINVTNAWATISVHVSDGTGKSAPRPRDLEARVLAGELIRIPVPLTGIDADGDGVTLLGISKPAEQGFATAGADWIEYESWGTPGTDTFQYAVEDWTGQRSVATVRVGVAPRPQGSAQVVARDDVVTVRPGRSVEVRVLANDVDNSGDELEIDPVLDKPEDLQASVVGRRIVVQAPDQDGQVEVVYTARNARGGSDTAALRVEVSADAPIAPPIAKDVVVPASETLNAATVEVDVLEVAQNPSGPLSDLQVSVDSSAADVARVLPGGTIEVALGKNARTLPYVLTNTAPGANGVFSYAFITVPALGDFPPVRRPGAAALTTYAGRDLPIDLDSQIQVAPGRHLQVDETTLVSTRAAGTVQAASATTLLFRANAAFSGPASISFVVRDGDVDDPNARDALITLPVTVYAYEDHPPTFEPSVLDVAPDERTQVDLVAFVEAPVAEAQQDAGEYTYTRAGAAPAGITATVDGTVLTLVAAADVPRGTVGSIGLRIDYGGIRPLEVTVDFRVVASQRALARVPDRTVTGEAGRSQVVPVLDGSEYNPFAAPLRLVAALPEAVPDAKVSVVGTGVQITPPVGFVGPLVVRVRALDATGDPDRAVEGRITVVVRDVPATPTAPRISEVGDKSVTLAWDAPAANGAPITGYRVTAQPGGAVTDCPGTTCVVTGLTNDQQYTFTVVARNDVGDSAASPASAQARPDVRPAAPAAPTLAWGDGKVTATWTAPANTGSPIKDYQVELSPAPPSGPAVVTTSSTSYSFSGLANGTAYSVRVRATNAAPDPGDWSGWSATAVPAGVPGAPVAPSASGAQVGPGSYRITVTWGASDPNGDAVSGYEVQVDGDVTPVAAGQTSYTFAAQRGVSYTIDVRALNKAGPSSWASTTGEVWTAPTPVQNLEVLDTADDPTPFGAGAVRARWSAPSDSGGVPLAGYLVSLDGGAPIEVPTRSYTFTGLTGGTHTVTVVAVNQRDAASAPVSAVGSTVTVPQAPTADAPDTSVPLQVTFTWQGGGDGGSPVTGWRYELSSGGVVIQEGDTTSPALVVTGTAGQDLTLVVRAVNVEGESAGSVPVTVTVLDNGGGGG